MGVSGRPIKTVDNIIFASSYIAMSEEGTASLSAFCVKALRIADDNCLVGFRRGIWLSKGAPRLRKRGDALRVSGDAPMQAHKVMARPEGVEPPTEEVEAPCSIQLSYGRARDCPN